MSSSCSTTAMRHRVRSFGSETTILINKRFYQSTTRNRMWIYYLFSFLKGGKQKNNKISSITKKIVWKFTRVGRTLHFIVTQNLRLSNQAWIKPIHHRINLTILKPNPEILNQTCTDTSETNCSQIELGWFMIIQNKLSYSNQYPPTNDHLYRI